MTIQHTSVGVVRLAPSMPLARAARDAMEASLGLLGQRLASAAPQDSLDDAAIGELRTTARQGLAALDIFRTTIGHLDRRKMRKCVRRVHLAARGACVCRHQIAIVNARDQTAAHSIVRDSLVDLAANADRSLRRIAHRYEPKRFDALRLKLMASLHQPDTLEPAGATALEYGAPCEAHPSRTRFRLIDAARHRMPRILNDLQEASLLDVHVPANLHLLARRVERLHFSIDWFGSCLRDAINDVASVVSTALTQLEGADERNGLTSIVDHLAGVHSNAEQDLHYLAAHFRTDARRGSDAFIQSWQEQALHAVYRPIERALAGPTSGTSPTSS